MVKPRIRWMGAVVAATLAAGPGVAEVADPILTQNGIRYACTGIAETKNDPRWTRFALKLVFAVEPDGALLAGVKARITDPAGRPILDVDCARGPWLMAELQPGRYRVHATAIGGYAKTAAFSIGAAKQTHVVIRFPAAAGK